MSFLDKLGKVIIFIAALFMLSLGVSIYSFCTDNTIIVRIFCIVMTLTNALLGIVFGALYNAISSIMNPIKNINIDSLLNQFKEFKK